MLVLIQQLFNVLALIDSEFFIRNVCKYCCDNVHLQLMTSPDYRS